MVDMTGLKMFGSLNHFLCDTVTYQGHVEKHTSDSLQEKE